MGRFAGYLTNQLVENKLIEPSQQEIYHYGLERLWGKAITLSVLLVLAASIKMVAVSVLFLCFFLMLRGRTGGYHASTEKRCFIGTIVIYLFAMKCALPFLTEHKMITVLCIVAASFIILVWAPVNHPNIGFTENEIRQYRKRSRVMLGMELLGIAILWLFDVKAEYCISAVLGMATCAFLVAIAKIVKQEVMK